VQRKELEARVGHRHGGPIFCCVRIELLSLGCGDEPCGGPQPDAEARLVTCGQQFTDPLDGGGTRIGISLAWAALRLSAPDPQPTSSTHDVVSVQGR
jgi:hypothetical protein